MVCLLLEISTSRHNWLRWSVLFGGEMLSGNLLGWPILQIKHLT